MEAWRKVFRDGFVPQISTAGLASLETALETDDQRLLQGATTSPPPLMCAQDWPVDGCCVITYTGWQGGKALKTVSECEEYFARLCDGVDNELGERGACRWFLNAFDDWPRHDVAKNLLPEVRLALAQRDGLA